MYKSDSEGKIQIFDLLEFGTHEEHETIKHLRKMTSKHYIFKAKIRNSEFGLRDLV